MSEPVGKYILLCRYPLSITHSEWKDWRIGDARGLFAWKSPRGFINEKASEGDRSASGAEQSRIGLTHRSLQQHELLYSHEALSCVAIGYKPIEIDAASV